jgi:flagellar protein FliO/FliZ
MPRLASCCLVVTLLIVAAPARADRRPPTAAIPSPSKSVLHPLPPRDATRTPKSSSSGWWLGTAGVVLALAVFGGISLASRRLAPQGQAGGLQVVGRVSLTPRQSVYLVRAGDRTLVLGAGGQGPPTLLGEWAGGQA